MSRTDAHTPFRLFPNWDALWDVGIGDEEPLFDHIEHSRYFRRTWYDGEGVRRQNRRIRQDRSYTDPRTWDVTVTPTVKGAWYAATERIRAVPARTVVDLTGPTLPDVPHVEDLDGTADLLREIGEAHEEAAWMAEFCTEWHRDYACCELCGRCPVCGHAWIDRFAGLEDCGE